MSEENKALVRRFSDEVFAKWNVDAVDEFVSPDFVNHPVFPGLFPDREGIKQAAAMFRSAFPRWELSEDGIVAEGDYVVFWGTGRGIQEGEFMGVPATGKEISIPGVHIVRVVEGKIVEHIGYSDQLATMRQLGVLT